MRESGSGMIGCARPRWLARQYKGFQMRGWGIALVVLGFVGLIAGMVMDTSVTSGLSRVENIGLLSRQASVLTVSALAFLTGCVLIGFAAVCDGIQRLGPTIAANMPRQPSPPPQGGPVGGGPGISDASRPAGGGDGTKICQKCYAMAKEEAEQCPRCGAEFPLDPAVGVRVKSHSFGKGTVLAVEGDTSRMKFETIDKPMTINTASLTVMTEKR